MSEKESAREERVDWGGTELSREGSLGRLSRKQYRKGKNMRKRECKEARKI